VCGQLRFIRPPEHDAFLETVSQLMQPARCLSTVADVFGGLSLAMIGGERHRMARRIRSPAKEPCPYPVERMNLADESVGQFKLPKETEIIDCARNHDRQLPCYFNE
jgi:hypothetical protein